MEVSVSNFLCDEWLGSSYTIEKVFINDIPARLAAIGSGQLDMGIFPEPVAAMGVFNGLERQLYEPVAGYCPDVLVFTGKALKEQQEAVQLFHRAYNKAVEELIRNKEAALDILMEKIPNLKPEARELIVLPAYTKAALPDANYINKIITWAKQVLGKDLKVSADDLVARQFVQ